MGIKHEFQFVWTEDAKAVLEKHHREGLSSSQIAAVLNKRWGLSLTRNSVIGKIHRMGLARPVTAAKSTFKTGLTNKTAKPTKGARGRGTSDASVIALYAPLWAANASAPKAVSREVIPDADDLLTARPWETRMTGECAWPFGPPEATLSCCKPVARDGYCTKHVALGFQASTHTASSDDRLAKWMSRVA